MARTDPQVNFRIPVDLKTQIEQAAAESNRTVTAEIVERLQNSFSKAGAAKQVVDAKELEKAQLEQIQNQFHFAIVSLVAARGDIEDVQHRLAQLHTERLSVTKKSDIEMKETEISQHQDLSCLLHRKLDAAKVDAQRLEHAVLAVQTRLHQLQSDLSAPSPPEKVAIQ